MRRRASAPRDDRLRLRLASDERRFARSNRLGESASVRVRVRAALFEAALGGFERRLPLFEPPRPRRRGGRVGVGVRVGVGDGDGDGAALGKSRRGRDPPSVRLEGRGRVPRAGGDAFLGRVAGALARVGVGPGTGGRGGATRAGRERWRPGVAIAVARVRGGVGVFPEREVGERGASGRGARRRGVRRGHRARVVGGGGGVRARRARPRGGARFGTSRGGGHRRGTVVARAGTGRGALQELAERRALAVVRHGRDLARPAPRARSERGREGGERAEGEERGGGRPGGEPLNRRDARREMPTSPRPRTRRTSPCSGCRAGPSSASAWVTSPARASSRCRVARAPQPLDESPSDGRDAPIPLRSRAHAGGSSRASSLREVAATLRRRSARDFTRALVVRRRFARPLRVAADRWGPPTPPRRGTPPLRPPRPSPLRRRRTTARRSRSASPR